MQYKRLITLSNVSLEEFDMDEEGYFRIPFSYKFSNEEDVSVLDFSISDYNYKASFYFTIGNPPLDNPVSDEVVDIERILLFLEDLNVISSDWKVQSGQVVAQRGSNTEHNAMSSRDLNQFWGFPLIFPNIATYSFTYDKRNSIPISFRMPSLFQHSKNSSFINVFTVDANIDQTKGARFPLNYKLDQGHEIIRFTTITDSNMLRFQLYDHYSDRPVTASLNNANVSFTICVY